jgi:hypothetical protein
MGRGSEKIRSLYTNPVSAWSTIICEYFSVEVSFNGLLSSSNSIVGGRAYYPPEA